MKPGTTQDSGEVDTMAEGSPRSQEVPEPDSRLKTTTMPIVRIEDESVLETYDTGPVSVVNLKAEGRDDDDVQDASLESGSPIREASPVAIAGRRKRSSMPRVLIVEDTIELAEVIQATLDSMKMETFHETHGSKALSRFLELDPDIVLLDIGLPDMTGWKILDIIKERHEHNGATMPIVIVITAYDDPANRLVGKLQGVHNYLVKPFTTDEIEAVIREALSGTV